VTAAAGSRGTATVAVVAGAGALTFGALVAVAACCSVLQASQEQLSPQLQADLASVAGSCAAASPQSQA
jgi:hypothetical protein